jgi:uncharacterized membrane-anchored protein YitT (DUF2179 family)
MNLKKKYLKSFYWRDYIVILLGLTIYATSLTGFLIPYKVVMGGLGGVSLLIKYATGFPLWASFITLNSFLLIFAWFFLGKKYVISTLFSSIALTIILNLAERFITEPLVGNETMAILIGAIGCGIGLGMVLASNSSTGGTDIIAAIITKYRYLSMGRVLMYIDVFIILSSYLLFQSIEKIIIGFVISGLLYYVVDMVINGSRQSVQFFIFSPKYDEIATHINSELGRGCSVIDGVGWYSKQPQKIVMLMTRSSESTTVFRLVKGIDKDAFITQANVSGVYGKGFEPMIGTK